jgi:broad specificity phosphatase PhoE
MTKGSKPSLTQWSVTTIDLLRHGQTEGGDIFRGSTDVALTDEGFKLMVTAADRLKLQPVSSDYSRDGVSYWNQIISSPLIRCRSFAEFISSNEELPMNIKKDLREISFGDWDGRAFDDIRKEDEESFSNYWRNPVLHSPPNAEPFSEFCLRVEQLVEQLVKEFEGQHLLLVTHGGVYRAILNYILGGDSFAFMRYEVPYACISRIRVYHDEDKHHFQLYFHHR